MCLLVFLEFFHGLYSFFFFVHLLVAMQCPEADILDLLATGLMIFMALLKCC